MTNPSHTPGPDEENLRAFLEQIFGGQLPPGTLDGMDLGELARQAGLPTDPVQLRAAAAQMQHLMAQGGDGPVNWTLGRDLARQTAHGAVRMPGMPEPKGSPGDPAPNPTQVRNLVEAAHVASLWLGQVVDVDVPTAPPAVWSRATWVEKTLPRWQKTVEPVSLYMARAIGDALKHQMGEMPSVPGVGDVSEMLTRMGGTMFGVQFGHAIGSLAREVFGGTDLGLPLVPDAQPSLLAANINDFLDGTDLDPSALRIFLAAREVAHCALFRSTPWLAEHLFGAIEDYARGITLDLGHLEDMMRDLDVSDPSALSGALPEGVFEFTRSESQERALEELATTLALIEGWVDHVVAQALDGKLPRLDAMRETIRRRRASGGPAEQMLAAVVGLELRPRRIREALSWWDAVFATEGAAGRERVWGHPDLLPSSDVLSGTPQPPRPAAQADASSSGSSPCAQSGTAGDQPGPEQVSLPEDFDAELEKLLRGEGAENAPREDTSGGVSSGKVNADELGTSGNGAYAPDQAGRGSDGEDDHGPDHDDDHGRSEGKPDGPSNDNPDGHDGHHDGPSGGNAPGTPTR
ncbi:zinc-dependent metalloprotease [Devriesea agamarum]|uniref:zinc-dependent metalloprotease n=1 Tax=Devriesea agamarum TaxID=472569 RepID=UPI00071C80B6|nr:zinc-dependent metalloprotease [Devriesea agamarum]